MHRLAFDHRRSWLRLVAAAILVLLSHTAAAAVFWSVTDEAGRQNWLLGTLHSEDPRLLEWPAPLVGALTAADRIALELVPDAAMLEKLREAMVSGDEPLSQVLDAALYESVVTLLTEKYGMTESAVDGLEPWAVALTLGTQPPETGMYMDLMLSYRAQGAGLDVVALETVDEQIDFLAGMRREDQISLIREAAANHDAYESEFDEVVAAYLDGDLDRLDALASGQLANLNGGLVRYFEERGLAERNRRMLERAEGWLEEGDLIIAVGALHLQGESGLVALLKQRGWRLEGIY